MKIEDCELCAQLETEEHIVKDVSSENVKYETVTVPTCPYCGCSIFELNKCVKRR